MDSYGIFLFESSLNVTFTPGIHRKQGGSVKTSHKHRYMVKLVTIILASNEPKSPLGFSSSPKVGALKIERSKLDIPVIFKMPTYYIYVCTYSS